MRIFHAKSGGSILNGMDHRFKWVFLYPKYWTTWATILFLSIIWFIPRRLRDKLAAVISRWYLKKPSNHRFHARINLQQCFPKLSLKERQQLLAEHFKCFFQIMLDAPLFWWGTDTMIEKRVNVVGFAAAEELINAKKSVVFLASHSAALEVSIAVFSMYYQMQGFYKPFKNPLVDWLMFRVRTKRGSRLAARGEGFATVIRDLKKGMPLFYLSDEDLGRDGSVFAPFFGNNKATLAMLPRIARISDASVFPIYTHYLQDKGIYQINVLPALHGYPSGNEQVDAIKLNEATEDSILISPEQYLWKLRLFKTTEFDGQINPYNLEKKKLSESSLRH